MVRSSLILCALSCATQAESKTWRGLVVAPEVRCSSYEAQDYAHPPWLEDVMIFGMSGRIYAPYTRTDFTSAEETEIDHLVAKSEAHDSGLCKASRETRRHFASDPRNMILAARETNREKGSKDASEWLPEENRCWFAKTNLDVRLTYGLTIDAEEKEALEQIISDCESFMIILNAIVQR